MELGLGTCLLHDIGTSTDNVRTFIAAAETTHDASIKNLRFYADEEGG